MKKNHLTKTFQILFFSLFFLLISANAQANILEFYYDTVFSGYTPGGEAPWLTATFDDNAASSDYDVRLTLSTNNLVEGYENVAGWYFNLDPNIDTGGLEFQAVDTSGAIPNGIGFDTDAYKADGDGFYDLYFEFPPPPGSFTSKFTAGEKVIYDIRHSSVDLTALSFNFPSVEGGGEGTYLSAGHIQNIPTSCGSGWIGATTTVPEPLSSFLYVFGSFVLFGFRRIRNKFLT